MSLFNNWFQIAKQKPLLYGWLLDSSVVHFDHRNEMQMQGQLFETGKAPKAFVFGYGGQNPNPNLGYQSGGGGGGELDEDELKMIPKFIATHLAESDWIEQMEHITEYEDLAPYDKLMAEIFNPQTDYMKGVYQKFPQLKIAFNKHKGHVQMAIEDWLKDFDKIANNSSDDDDV